MATCKNPRVLARGAILWFGIVGGAVLNAQPPAILPGGIVNAASRMPPSLASGSIARGSLFAIDGVRLGSGATDVSVRLTHGAVALDLHPIDVTPRRIIARMPEDAPLGAGHLVVTRPRESSKPTEVNVMASSFGIFTENERGWGPAAPVGPTSASLAHPAKPGEIGAVFGTGIGSETHPQIVIGGIAAPVLRVQRGRDQPGMNRQDKITFRIPSSTPSGCFVPIYARSSEVGPKWVSNTATIAISRTGPCRMPANWPLPPLEPGHTTGLMIFAHEAMTLRVEANRFADSLKEEASAAFLKAEGVRPSITLAQLVPPHGACVSGTGFFSPEILADGSWPDIILSQVTGIPQDAGSALRLQRGRRPREREEETREMPQDRSGVYTAPIGGEISRRMNLPLFLRPGSFTVSAMGGTVVGDFRVALTARGDFTWTDADHVTDIDRNVGVTLRWQDGIPNRTMFIFAIGVDQESTAMAVSLCATPAAAGRFTLGPDLLANFPATVPAGGPLPTLIALAAIDSRAPVSIRARGINAGFAIPIVLRGRTVIFR
jgi:uncharacterized protein (TIGR03437 family)